MNEEVFYLQDNPKFLEIYLRVKPETIAYGIPTNDRINVNVGLLLCLKLPMEMLPDPWTVVEDQQDLEKEKKEKELQSKMEEERRIVKEADLLAKK